MYDYQNILNIKIDPDYKDNILSFVNKCNNVEFIKGSLLLSKLSKGLIKLENKNKEYLVNLTNSNVKNLIIFITNLDNEIIHFNDVTNENTDTIKLLEVTNNVNKLVNFFKLTMQNYYLIKVDGRF